MANIANSALSEQKIDACPLSRGSSPPQVVTKLDSQSLQVLFGLTPTSVCDTVFIAIDFENIANIQHDLLENLECEVGLAVLDTKDFYSMSSARLISTHNFASGTSDYQERARKRFLFGNSVAIAQKDMLKSIESSVPLDYLLGFDFSKFKITTLDTQRISHDSTTLCRLLLTIGFPFTKLHCDGNDAHFTLKALLLLVIRGHAMRSGAEKRLNIMKEIALSPLPRHIQLQNELAVITDFSHTDPQKKASEKRAKRMQRSRKHQSKLWNAEVQEKIRVERTAKRLATEFSDVKSNCTKASITRS